MRPLSLLTICACILSGCVTISDPVPVGRDTYMISLGARGGMSSNGELVSQALQKAGAFCRSTGREIEMRSSTSSGVQGWTPQSGQVVFACLAANDPEYARPTYSPTPPIVIEHRER